LKEKLNSDGNKIYRYQQNKQLYLDYMSMTVVGDPIIKKVEGCDPILQFSARYIFVPVPSQELDFQTITRSIFWLT
jgi:hypothetical protein